MSPAHFQDNLHVQENKDSTGRLWYTAGFSSAIGKYALNQNVFYAEGGNSFQNEQGVHWYTTREDAVEALKRVCTFSALVNGRLASPKASPSSSRPVVDPLSGGSRNVSPASTRDVVNLAGLPQQNVIHPPNIWNNSESGQNLTLSLPSSSQSSVPMLPSLSIPMPHTLGNPSAMPTVAGDWLKPADPDDLCRDFERKGLCPHGHGKRCTYLHLQQPWGTLLDSNWPDVSDKSLPVPPEFFSSRMVVLDKKGAQGRPWYTARYNNHGDRFRDGDRFVFYAEGGDSVPSDQCVRWYSTREAAVKALKRVYIFSFWAYRRGLSSHPSCDSRGPSPSSSRPVVDPMSGGYSNVSPSSSRPAANVASLLAQHEIHQQHGINNNGPGLHDMQLNPSNSQTCISIPPHLFMPHPSAMPQVSDSWLLPEKPEHLCWHFENHGSCPHGKLCTFTHLQQPWGQVLETNWSEVSDKSLPVEQLYFEKHLEECEKMDSTTGGLWYTARFNSAIDKCPGTLFQGNRCVFFAEGGGSVPNEQGVHWYSTREAAVEALERVYTFSLWAYDKSIRPPGHDQ